MEQLLTLQVVANVPETSVPACINQLVDKYQGLFQKPVGLPPRRLVDHVIPLLSDAPTFRLRPYRYTPQQKNEIEKQVQKMLDSGIIQQSTSPFASHVLLVKKKDREWRLCVDYRKLNAYTMKIQHPMPIFYEITDELEEQLCFLS